MIMMMTRTRRTTAVRWCLVVIALTMIPHHHHQKQGVVIVVVEANPFKRLFHRMTPAYQKIREEIHAESEGLGNGVNGDKPAKEDDKEKPKKKKKVEEEKKEDDDVVVVATESVETKVDGILETTAAAAAAAAAAEEAAEPGAQENNSTITEPEETVQTTTTIVEKTTTTVVEKTASANDSTSAEEIQPDTPNKVSLVDSGEQQQLEPEEEPPHAHQQQQQQSNHRFDKVEETLHASDSLKEKYDAEKLALELDYERMSSDFQKLKEIDQERDQEMQLLKQEIENLKKRAASEAITTDEQLKKGLRALEKTSEEQIQSTEHSYTEELEKIRAYFGKAIELERRKIDEIQEELHAKELEAYQSLTKHFKEGRREMRNSLENLFLSRFEEQLAQSVQEKEKEIEERWKERFETQEEKFNGIVESKEEHFNQTIKAKEKEFNLHVEEVEASAKKAFDEYVEESQKAEDKARNALREEYEKARLAQKEQYEKTVSKMEADHAKTKASLESTISDLQDKLNVTKSDLDDEKMAAELLKKESSAEILKLELALQQAKKEKTELQEDLSEAEERLHHASKDADYWMQRFGERHYFNITHVKEDVSVLVEGGKRATVQWAEDSFENVTSYVASTKYYKVSEQFYDRHLKQTVDWTVEKLEPVYTKAVVTPAREVMSVTHKVAGEVFEALEVVMKRACTGLYDSGHGVATKVPKFTGIPQNVEYCVDQPGTVVDTLLTVLFWVLVFVFRRQIAGFVWYVLITIPYRCMAATVQLCLSFFQRFRKKIKGTQARVKTSS